MAGKVASPIFVNGADDDLLVGDTVDVVTAEVSAGLSGASLTAFEELLAENGKPEEQEALKSEAGKAMSPSKGEVNTATSGKSPSAKVAALKTNDEDAANKVVAEMKANGEIDALAGNETAIDKLMKATGLETRLSDITPSFNKKDYNSNVKLKLLKEYDWSRTACDKSMAGLLSNLSALFPNLNFGNESDSRAKQAAKDTSLLAALRCGAKWLTDERKQSIIEDSGRNLSDMSSNFLKSSLSDFQSDDQVKFARKLVDKMTVNEAEDGTLTPTDATSRLAVYNPRLVKDILRFYPWGFTDSYAMGLEEAYNTLITDLDKIDPNWHLMKRGTDMIANLELYMSASDTALYVLSYADPHAINVALTGRHKQIGYTNRIYKGVIMPLGFQR